MSVASVNAIVLSLTEEKSMVETEIMFIDQRREMLARETSAMCNDYQAKLAKSISIKGEDPEDEVESFNDEDFQIEFAAAQARLENQDKSLLIQKENLETKVNAIKTQLEGSEKQLQKNIEKEFKAVGGG